MYSYIVSKIAGNQEVPKTFLTSINKDTKKVETEVVNLNESKDKDFYTMMIDVEELHDNMKPYLNNLYLTVNPPSVVQFKKSKIETYKVDITLYNIVQPLVLEVNSTIHEVNLKIEDNTEFKYRIQDNKIILEFDKSVEGSNKELTGTISVLVL